jgi:hypothetical protein
MKVEHQIVNIILYMSHFYRNVANFFKFWLNSGYWKYFKALDLSWFNFEVLKRFGYIYGYSK